MEAILSQFLNQFLINFNQFSHSDSQKHTKTRCRLTKTYKSTLCLTQTHKNVQNSSLSHTYSQKHIKFHFVSLRLTKIYKISLCLTQTRKNIQNSTLSHSESQKHTKFHFVSHSDSQKHTKFHFVSQNSTLSQNHKTIQNSTLSQFFF